MKYKYLAIIALLVFALGAMPASAFTAQKLTINVQPNGDANIQFSYKITAMEKLLYALPYKEEIIRTALGSLYPSKTVDNIRCSKSITDLTVRNFATISTSGKKTTYKTPAVNFMAAQRFVGDYPGISPDFSPDKTVVKFPKGGQYTYPGVTGIPAITYTK